jgi:ribosomal protein L40E
MICQACNTENPDQAKFCMGCGDALQNLCADCGTELPNGAKFCFSCGAKVGDPAPTPATASTPTPTPAEAPQTATESAALDRLAQYVPKELLS